MIQPFQWWQKQTPALQRQLAAGGLIALVLTGIIAMAALTQPASKPVGKPAIIQHILTDSDPRSLGIDGISAQLRDLLQKNEEQSRRLVTLEEQQKRDTQAGEQRFRQWSATEHESYENRLKEVQGEIDSKRQNQDTTTIPATKRPLTMPQSSERLTRHDISQAFPQSDNTGLLPPATTQVSPPNGLSSQTQNGLLQIREIRDEKQTPNKAEPQAKTEAASSDFFIPAGSILSGVLLNGLDAPTGKKAKKEPIPVLFRVKKEAILPNHFHADLKECFLLASGFGDLSAERAYFRGETFSCVRSDGGVIEVPMNAYATGEDGKNGIRGRVVSKQGALLAQSMTAGFLRGFSDAFGRNQIPVLMTGGLGGLGSTTPFQNTFSPQAMEGGTLKGAGYAMERLSHFYMDMAEEMYPVIEVDASRKVTFIVQKGTALKLKQLPRPQLNP